MKRVILILLSIITMLAVMPFTAYAEECEHYYISDITRQPTCYEEGEITFACIYCSSHYTEVVPCTGHTLISQITTKPTCDASGERTYACIYCSYHYFEEVASLGHDLVSISIKKSNCVSTGSETFKCRNCDYSYTVDLEPNSNNHSYQPKYYPATCETRGYTKFVCSRCNSSYIDKSTYVDPFGHNYVSKVTKKATYTAEGVKTFTCKNCANKYTKPITKLVLSAPSITSKSASSTSVTLKWKKDKNATGYQIEYSTDSKYKAKKTVKITKNTTVSKTLSKLSKKKKYYIRVRSYRVENKKTAYSAWTSFNIKTK